MDTWIEFTLCLGPWKFNQYPYLIVRFYRNGMFLLFTQDWMKYKFFVSFQEPKNPMGTIRKFKGMI